MMTESIGMIKEKFQAAAIEELPALFQQYGRDERAGVQAAVEKGFQQAGAAWGGDLPSICGDTHTAVGKLFDDYYAKNGVSA